METQQDKRPEAFLFATRKGTPLSANNFLKRQLKGAGENVRKKLEEQGATLPSGFLEGLTHQALRRSCATHMQHLGSLKDIQAHLRHARLNVTAEVYLQEIPARFRKESPLMPSKLLICGAPGMTRTCDLLVRSQTLYPTELRARCGDSLKLPYLSLPHQFQRYQ